MKKVDNTIKVLQPLVEILDEKNITNCLYYSSENKENECCLVIDTSKLSQVNKTIIYAMADIYFDNFAFSDELRDDFLEHSISKKESFDDLRFACFHFPNLGHEYSDYTTGFFIEFAKAFIQQEPITEVENLYTVEELDRLNKYENNGRPDKSTFRLLVSLGKFHPLRSNSLVPATRMTRFSDGKVFSGKEGDSLKFLMAPTKTFELTTDRALENLKKYKEVQEEKAKEKTKTTKNG